MGGPKTIARFPLAGILEMMTVRLRAEDALDTHMDLAFATTDSDEVCALEIRQGVCQFHAAPPVSTDATLTFLRQFMTEFAVARTSFAEGLEAGEVTLVGNLEAVENFFMLFDSITGTPEIIIAGR